MNYIGISILFISLISFSLVFILHKYTKKVYTSYYFYLIVSILYLIYFVVLRYSRNIEDLINFDAHKFNVYEIDYMSSFTKSKVLSLDLCPMISILLPLSLIFDKTRTTSKVFALYGLLGGIVTIFSSVIFVKEISINYFEFIFVGEDPNYLFFFSHYFIALLSLIVLCNSKKFTKWSWLGSLLFISLFISYIAIMSSCLNIKCNTTGLTQGDWYSPYDSLYFWYSQYSMLYKLTSWDYRACISFWYIIAVLIIWFFMIIKNIFTKDANYCCSYLWWNRLVVIDKFIDKKILKHLKMKMRV